MSEEVKQQRQKELNSANRKQWSQWIMSYHSVLSEQMENLVDEDVQAWEQNRLDSMNKRVNPAFVLRNYLIEDAIKLAEKHDDFSGVQKLLNRAMDPFNTHVQAGGSERPKCTLEQRPDSRFYLCVSCSS